MTPERINQLRALLPKRWHSDGYEFIDALPDLLDLADRALAAEASDDEAQREVDDMHSAMEELTRDLATAEARAERLREAAMRALHEMRHTAAPRDSFTDAVDALDAALTEGGSHDR